jgi:hypothetical protein
MGFYQLANNIIVFQIFTWSEEKVGMLHWPQEHMFFQAESFEEPVFGLVAC